MKVIYGLRSAVFWLFFVVLLFIYGFALLVCIPFCRQSGRYAIIRSWCRVIVVLMKAICGVDYRFIGMGNIPKKGPFILLSKHQSGWETLALTAFVPRRLSYIYKKELHKIPIFGWGLASLGMFSIDRAQGRNAFALMKQEVPKFFEKGWGIILFPEGTRTAPGQVVKYKSGGARLAECTGAPVIPVALNSGECWPKHSFVIRPGVVKVVFNSPINPEGMSAHELNEKVFEIIENEMAKISPKFYRKKSGEQQ